MNVGDLVKVCCTRERQTPYAEEKGTVVGKSLIGDMYQITLFKGSGNPLSFHESQLTLIARESDVAESSGQMRDTCSRLSADIAQLDSEIKILEKSLDDLKSRRKLVHSLRAKFMEAAQLATALKKLDQLPDTPEKTKSLPPSGFQALDYDDHQDVLDAT